MANHASAEKRNRQRITRTTKNRAAKSALRSALKKARAATGAGASDVVKAAHSALDRAATKGTIPAKRAARTKGRLAAALHKASQNKSA
jgi:small subunit ribosomal protein S20